MLNKTLTGLIVAGLTSAGGMVLGPQSALAMPSAHGTPMPIAADLFIQPVKWIYVTKRHGHRYKARRAGFNHYYGGYWYAQPWWSLSVGPVIVYSATVHGPRYRHKRAGFGYYHRGYWYHRRWW